MNLLSIFALALGLILATAGWFSLPTMKLRISFCAAVLLISSYEFLPTPESWEHGEMLWVKHIGTYIGEFILYLFVVEFGRRHIAAKEMHKARPKKSQYVVPSVFMFASTNSTALFGYVSQQGLAHIFVLPLFMLIYYLVKLEFGLTTSKYRPVLKWFMIGLSLWVMIHISEFTMESQKVGGPLKSHIEVIEKLWLTLGTAAFIYALYKYKKISRSGAA